MKVIKRSASAAALILALGVAGPLTADAHGQAGQSPMSAGSQAPMAGPGTTSGPGMNGQAMGSGMGAMGQGMGQGMSMGMGMGQGNWGRGMDAPKFGGNVMPEQDLSAEGVEQFLENRLEMHGNNRLKVGTVEERGEDTIVAEIVTVDGSLVQRIEVDRRTGAMQRVN